MNKEKQAYKAPSSELLVVRFERNVMSDQGVASLQSWIQESDENDLDF